MPNDLSILAGEENGPPDVVWRDVAGTAMVNGQALADQLKAGHLGNHEPLIMLPSPSECLNGDDHE